MARPDKIRAGHLEPRVRELAASGKASREIAEALTSEGHAIGHATVARFLREEVSERRDAAKSIAVADAATTVPLITAGLRKLAEIAMKRAEETEDDSAAARLVASGSDAWMKLHKVTVGDDPPKPTDDTPLPEPVEGA